MKKKLSILIALVMAISLCLSPVAVSATDTPTIDGVLSDGEWGDPTFVNEGYFRIYVLDDYEYLYVAFETLGGTYLPVGSGQGMMNLYVMNPVTWECWAYCWGTGNPDLIKLKYTYPPDPTETLVTDADFGVTATVFELQIPLSELESINLGDTINFHFLSYAEGMSDWGANSWLYNREYTLVKPTPVRALDAFDVFVRFGYDSTRYDPNNALISSIEAMGEYNGTRYMLEIPKDCVVTGKAGRINWLWLAGIDGAVLSFVGGDASFSEPCTLYITDGGRLYQDYWTGEWLGGGEWVEVGTFTSIVGGEAHLD